MSKSKKRAVWQRRILGTERAAGGEKMAEKMIKLNCMPKCVLTRRSPELQFQEEKVQPEGLLARRKDSANILSAISDKDL